MKLKALAKCEHDLCKTIGSSNTEIIPIRRDSGSAQYCWVKYCNFNLFKSVEVWLLKNDIYVVFNDKILLKF